MKKNLSTGKFPGSNLTPGEEATVLALMGNPRLSKAEAYLQGFPNARRWKRTSVQARATDLFKRPRVAAAMKELWKARTGTASSDHEQVIRYLESIAFSSLPGIIEFEKGMIRVKEFDHLTTAQKVCIKKFKCTTVKQIIDRKPVPVSVVELGCMIKLRL